MTQNFEHYLYGWGFGNSQHKYSYSRSFSLDKLPHKFKLCVDGYGINSTTEVSVKLNGHLLGYLKPGGNPTQTCFEVDVAHLTVGTNTVVYTQSNPGNTWGVGGFKETALSNAGFLPAVILLLDDEEAE